jgi:hypothetical protein
MFPIVSISYWTEGNKSETGHQDVAKRDERVLGFYFHGLASLAAQSHYKQLTIWQLHVLQLSLLPHPTCRGLYSITRSGLCKKS